MSNTDFTTLATDIRVGDTVNLVSRYGQMIVTSIEIDERNNRIIATGVEVSTVGNTHNTVVIRYVPSDPVTITRSAVLTEQSIDWMLTDTLRAIDYWSEVQGYMEDGDRLTGLRITDTEDEDKAYTVDVGTLRIGAELFLTGQSNYAGNGSKYGLEKLRLALETDNEDGDYDAFDLDALIQLGLFGRIQYS